MRRLRTELLFVGAYVRANLRAAMEYRFTFWANVLSMFLNDLMWIVFWALFFTHFPAVRGYDLRDVLTIWAVAALGFGVAVGIFGNCNKYATLVAEGRLDYYLLLPRPVLLHVLVSHMSITSWGDAAFGLILYCAIVQPGPLELLAYLAVSLAAGALIAAYFTIGNALAFWLGQAEGLAMQLNNALITLSTYPTTLFSGLVRVLLFTAIPAGFIAYVPVRFLREWQPWQLAATVGAAVVFALIAHATFARGLRRYESGNLVAMRT
jgi:ABC-2 type transport system permease protein